ncbi:hypothetical protein ACM44_02390 [Chryseobacterium koreense CCUG 49689]|uniref:Uncharacterized protein n=1 Tax=Chryseobacterium koreense CCUG 49689 TaxID=1304281 RepID=A0A0J7J1L7_9FLAO|nr:hypothetical protein ACM44_02390 [Chryseobacterium koreense CCUG 49689]
MDHKQLASKFLLRFFLKLLAKSRPDIYRKLVPFAVSKLRINDGLKKSYFCASVVSALSANNALYL